jgi:hypothetical protein
MKSDSTSVIVPKNTRTMRDDPGIICPRVIRELRYRDVFVEHSRSTR